MTLDTVVHGSGDRPLRDEEVEVAVAPCLELLTTGLGAELGDAAVECGTGRLRRVGLGSSRPGNETETGGQGHTSGKCECECSGHNCSFVFFGQGESPEDGNGEHCSEGAQMRRTVVGNAC